MLSIYFHKVIQRLIPVNLKKIRIFGLTIWIYDTKCISLKANISKGVKKDEFEGKAV